MIYLTSYTHDGLDNKPDGPSQVRPRWWLFDVGNGKAICLSTFRFN